MKKVILLGDSIRMNYGKAVEEALGPDVEVWQPEENCRFAKYTLRMLFDYREKLEGADVIHWNNGLWDNCILFEDGVFTELDEYVKTMVRIAKILKQYAPKVIFATTTPAHPDFKHHSTELTKRYNEAVVCELQKLGVEINDLFAAMLPHCLDGLREDKLHLNDLGVKICAEQTVQAIRTALEA